MHFLGNRAVFNRVDSYQGWVGLALLRSVIRPENLHHSLKQLDAKLKPVTTWSLAFFPRFRLFANFYFEFLLALQGIFHSSDCLIEITLVLDLRYSIAEKHSFLTLNTSDLSYRKMKFSWTCLRTSTGKQRCGFEVDS